MCTEGVYKCASPDVHYNPSGSIFGRALISNGIPSKLLFFALRCFILYAYIEHGKGMQILYWTPRMNNLVG
jgi:hypothetical protein